MKQVHNFWFPDYETHFPRMLDKSMHNTGIARYQWQAREFAINSCEQKRNCIDIGSNVGLWSYDLVKHFEQVIAFEPVQDSIDCFKKNVLTDNYVIHQVALGNEDSFIDMNIVEGNSGHSHINPESIGKGKIPLKTLDSFNFKEIDMIKIDVEGFEEEILRGAENTIKSNKPLMIVEQQDHGYKNAKATLPSVHILQSWGYVVLEQFKKDWVLKYRGVRA